ncbi:MAG: RNB domain-containing ribonuclease, partial [Peptococcaceae bacterium]|nr:RNB domain-containing ribonuclease [Peptococcaceae bacterium]
EKEKRKSRDTEKSQNKNQGKDMVISAGSYRRLIAEAKGKPAEAIVSMLLLRSMNHAYYSAENRGHFGLASDCYCHFTSPIRRYPDLMVHRMILQAFDDQGKQTDRRTLQDKIEGQCQEASALERLAEDAERKIDSLWKASYMSQYVGLEFDGVISGVTEYGFYVSLENTAEGMVHVSRLEGYYEYLEEKMMLASWQNPIRYRLGDPVRVLLESVDVGAGYINFRPAEIRQQAAGRKSARKKLTF